MLRNAGATEVHMRICAPPIMHPCHFGIDMATQWELIAAKPERRGDPPAHRRRQPAYLDIDGLMTRRRAAENSFCTACFTGDYPMPVQLQMDKLVFERSGRGGKRVPVGAGLQLGRRPPLVARFSPQCEHGARSANTPQE